MRKFILVKIVIEFIILISLSATTAFANTNSCSEYLVGLGVKISDSNSFIDLNNNTNDRFKLEKSGYPTEVVRTLVKAREIMDKAKALHFVSKSKYDHLLEDLEILSEGLDKKSKNQTFLEMINNWFSFALSLEAKITDYEKMDLKDQKPYFQKMKLPIAFMTSHFITFLETKHTKFEYRRMNSMLVFMNKMNQSSDLLLYLFEFEKQVLKFFSTNEFINCKA
jgi:hypothetical protein